MSQKMPKSSTNAGSSGDNTSPRPPKRNIFQKFGNEAVYEIMETKEACVYRVDMPGCPKSDLTYWVDKNNLHFFADEPAMAEYKHAGRKYGGTMNFNPKTYDVKGAKAELDNGVLWVTVPKIPGTNATIDVIEKMLHVDITRPDVA